MIMTQNGICACGCGGPTSVQKKTDRASGRIKGCHSRYIRGHQPHPKHVGFSRVSKARIASKFKFCGKCRTSKLKELFYRAKQTTDGYMSKCKECQKEYYRQYTKTPSCKASVRRSARKLRQSGYYRKLECRIDQRYRRAVTRARQVRRTFTLSFEEYVRIVTKPCAYCDLPLDQTSGYGLDRLNNKLDYTLENVVQCCSLCNCVRGNLLTPDEMKQIVGPAIRLVREGRMLNGVPLSVRAFGGLRKEATEK